MGSQELGLESLHYALMMVVCIASSSCLFAHLHHPQLLWKELRGYMVDSDVEPETIKLFCHLAVQLKQHPPENKSEAGEFLVKFWLRLKGDN